MAEGLSTTDKLTALQDAAIAVKPELGMTPEMSRIILKGVLEKEGYDLKNNSLEAATRAWQHRNGLLPRGFDETGSPDAVTLAMLAAKYLDDLPKDATAAQISQQALQNLVVAANDRSNGSKLDAVFERAGLGSELTAATAAPVATAPATAAPDLAQFDAAGNPIVAAPPAAAAPASADPLGDFIREKDKPVAADTAAPAAATSPDLGKAIGEGVDAARAAGGRLVDGVAETGGKVWDSVSGAFKDLGKKLEPAAPAVEDPAAKAEADRLKAEREAAAKAQLDAAGEAIKRRAAELREGAGAAATSVGETLGGLRDRLTQGLKNLGGGDAPATPDAGTAPAAPAADAAPAAVRPPAARVQPKF